MPAGDVAALAGAVSVILGIFISWYTARINRRTAKETTNLTADNNLLSQYNGLLQEIQEERTIKAKELTEVKERMGRMEEREHARDIEQRRRDGILRRYVANLHQDIYERKEPPPRPWPAELDD